MALPGCAGWLNCAEKLNDDVIILCGAAMASCAGWLSCAEKLNDEVIPSAMLCWLAALRGCAAWLRWLAELRRETK